MKTLTGFRPIADARSRVLILGSMPGPEALRRRQYYGFPGNHFWRVLSGALGDAAPESYASRRRWLLEHRIALWDVLRSCVRDGASDAAIHGAVLNDLPRFLKRHPDIRAVFLNGKTAQRFFLQAYGGRLHIPSKYLPSTSPAHASMTLERKVLAWKAVLPCLENRNPWC